MKPGISKEELQKQKEAYEEKIEATTQKFDKEFRKKIEKLNKESDTTQQKYDGLLSKVYEKNTEIYSTLEDFKTAFNDNKDIPITVSPEDKTKLTEYSTTLDDCTAKLGKLKDDYDNELSTRILQDQKALEKIKIELGMKDDPAKKIKALVEKINANLQYVDKKGKTEELKKYIEMLSAAVSDLEMMSYRVKIELLAKLKTAINTCQTLSGGKSFTLLLKKDEEGKPQPGEEGNIATLEADIENLNQFKATLGEIRQTVQAFESQGLKKLPHREFTEFQRAPVAAAPSSNESKAPRASAAEPASSETGSPGLSKPVTPPPRPQSAPPLTFLRDNPQDKPKEGAEKRKEKEGKEEEPTGGAKPPKPLAGPE
ncbi:MAG: hypothetical protein ACHQJ6_08610 [Candidatus Berkiellales bacterium]